MPRNLHVHQNQQQPSHIRSNYTNPYQMLENYETDNEEDKRVQEEMQSDD